MTAKPLLYHHKWTCMMLAFLLALHSVESAPNMAAYPLYGLSSGTTSISSTIDAGNQPTLQFPSMYFL
jgi:hypothetical protein